VSHKDGRVMLSAWVEPVLRDYAREAARAAGVEFSRWVEGAVQRAVAEQSVEKALRIYPVHASNLTDVVTALEDEREQLRAEVERLKDAGAVFVRSLERMTAERDALRRVYTAANDWLTNLGAKGHRYNDGVPGELMDAVDAVDALRSGKP